MLTLNKKIPVPDGRPGDHPLTDITTHKIRTYSRRADSLVRKLSKVVSSSIMWSFLYLLVREKNDIRVQGTEKRIPIREFEDLLANLLESTKPYHRPDQESEKTN
ncbi:MAG: hypothetical protein MUP22_12100 [Desulfobacterales bacterium]|nr:hypothetical protein [Desulfobacterales bacterium]